MVNEFLKAKLLSEKHFAVEKIIEYTLNGIIEWNTESNKYTAYYKDKLNNYIEFENFTSSGDSNLSMSKIVITNENGKSTILNGDITSDLHKRLLNSVRNQVKENNVLQDFL